MQPVAPRTMVRGPAALTMSFITSADSQPWQVRWPEVKYSSRVTFLTPRKGSRICVAFVNVSAMVSLSLFTRLRRRGPSPATSCSSAFHPRSPRTAGPQPRDVLQLGLPSSLASDGGAPAPRRPAAHATLFPDAQPLRLKGRFAGL